MRYFIIVLMCLSLTSCKTTATLSNINPKYKEYLVEGNKPPEDLEKWIPEKKIDVEGVGKIEADLQKDTLKRNSGFSFDDIIPDINIDDFKTD